MVQWALTVLIIGILMLMEHLQTELVHQMISLMVATIYILKPPHLSHTIPQILSFDFDLSNLISPFLSFSHHMYGSNIGSLIVYVNDSIKWTKKW